MVEVRLTHDTCPRERLDRLQKSRYPTPGG